MTETLANGYSSESTQWELSNAYQPGFQNPFCSCALDESSISIGRVNNEKKGSLFNIRTAVYAPLQAPLIVPLRAESTMDQVWKRTYLNIFFTTVFLGEKIYLNIFSPPYFTGEEIYLDIFSPPYFWRRKYIQIYFHHHIFGGENIFAYIFTTVFLGKKIYLNLFSPPYFWGRKYI